MTHPIRLPHRPAKGDEAAPAHAVQIELAQSQSVAHLLQPTGVGIVTDVEPPVFTPHRLPHHVDRIHPVSLQQRAQLREDMGRRGECAVEDHERWRILRTRDQDVGRAERGGQAHFFDRNREAGTEPLARLANSLPGLRILEKLVFHGRSPSRCWRRALRNIGIGSGSAAWTQAIRAK